MQASKHHCRSPRKNLLVLRMHDPDKLLQSGRPAGGHNARIHYYYLASVKTTKFNPQISLVTRAQSAVPARVETQIPRLGAITSELSTPFPSKTRR